MALNTFMNVTTGLLRVNGKTVISSRWHDLTMVTQVSTAQDQVPI